MKLRTKKTGPKFTFVSIEQAGMHVARDGEQYQALLAEDLDGAYVKYAPTIAASERATIDTSEVRRALTDAGARAVVVAPAVVPDVVPSRKKELAQSRGPLDQLSLLKEWFAAVKGKQKLTEAAFEEAMTSVSEAGL